MELLGADADLCAKSKLVPIRETGRGIHIDCRCVNPIQEFPGIGIIAGDNGFGVASIIAVDMRNRLVNASDCLDRQNIIQVFRAPIFLRSRQDIAAGLPAALIPP